MKKVKLGPRTFLYPMPAVLVGTKVNGTPNVMTAAWCGIAASDPPSLALGIRKERQTFKGMKEQGVFSVNIPSVSLAERVDYCGIYSGKKRDKSGLFDLFYGVLETAPMIRECPVNLECRVVHTLDLGSHVLFVGRIVETYVSEDCLTNEKPDAAKIDPLIYTAVTEEYRRLGDVVGRAFHTGRTLKR